MAGEAVLVDQHEPRSAHRWRGSRQLDAGGAQVQPQRIGVLGEAVEHRDERVEQLAGVRAGADDAPLEVDDGVLALELDERERHRRRIAPQLQVRVEQVDEGDQRTRGGVAAQLDAGVGQAQLGEQRGEVDDRTAVAAGVVVIPLVARVHGQDVVELSHGRPA